MNRIFDENGKELKTAKELGKAFYANYPARFKNAINEEDYDMRRIAGNICDCNGNGILDLLPLDDEAVVEGGKRYMKCRKCGCYSHL